MLRLFYSLNSVFTRLHFNSFLLYSPGIRSTIHNVILRELSSALLFSLRFHPSVVPEVGAEMVLFYKFHSGLHFISNLISDPLIIEKLVSGNAGIRLIMRDKKEKDRKWWILFTSANFSFCPLTRILMLGQLAQP